MRQYHEPAEIERDREGETEPSDNVDDLWCRVRVGLHYTEPRVVPDSSPRQFRNDTGIRFQGQRDGRCQIGKSQDGPVLGNDRVKCRWTSEQTLQIAEDSTGGQHNHQPGAARLVDDASNVGVDLPVHRDRTVEVEGENSGFHVLRYP